MKWFDLPSLREESRSICLHPVSEIVTQENICSFNCLYLPANEEKLPREGRTFALGKSRPSTTIHTAAAEINLQLIMLYFMTYILLITGQRFSPGYFID